MRRYFVRGNELSSELRIFSDIPGNEEQLLFRHGLRQDGETMCAYAIGYCYLPDGPTIEHEVIEYYPSNPGQTPWRKQVVREQYTNTAVKLFTIPIAVTASLVTLGYTTEGGDPANPREPWAHLQITDLEVLQRAFRELAPGTRHPDPETGGTYRVLKFDDGFINPTTLIVNNREITIKNIGEVTLTYAADTTDGAPGEITGAYFRKVDWVEGNLDCRVGMMA